MNENFRKNHLRTWRAGLLVGLVTGALAISSLLIPGCGSKDEAPVRADDGSGGSGGTSEQDGTIKPSTGKETAMFSLDLSLTTADTGTTLTIEGIEDYDPLAEGVSAEALRDGGLIDWIITDGAGAPVGTGTINDPRLHIAEPGPNGEAGGVVKHPFVSFKLDVPVGEGTLTLKERLPLSLSSQVADGDGTVLGTATIPAPASTNCGAQRQNACKDGNRYYCLNGCGVGSDLKCYGKCRAVPTGSSGSCGGKYQAACQHNGQYYCSQGCGVGSDRRCYGSCGGSSSGGGTGGSTGTGGSSGGSGTGMDELIQLVGNGTCAGSLNLLIIGDGYTAAELGKLRQDANATLSSFSSISPYRDHWNTTNVWLLAAASNESGIDDPLAANPADREKDTVFNTTMGTTVHHCTTMKTPTPRGQQLLSRAKQITRANGIVVLANTNMFGGCAGDIIVMTRNAGDTGQTIGHELGHSLFNLDDEYVPWNGQPHCGYIGPRDRNTTRNGANPPWRNIINSAIEGAQYCAKGIYRPEKTCLMNESKQFCKVCKTLAEAWYARRPNCPAPTPRGCFGMDPSPCTDGTVCANNGSSDSGGTHCCRKPFTGTKTCSTNEGCDEAKGEICSFGGPPDNKYYCTTPQADAKCTF